MSKPAEVFPMCEYLRDEIAERGWSPAELSRRAVLPEPRVAEILDAPNTRVLIYEAERLAVALGVQAATLLNLQLAYRRAHG